MTAREVHIGEKDHEGSIEERTGERQNVIVGATTRILDVGEDIIYVLTALLLAAGALMVLGITVYDFAKDVPEGATHAVEIALNSLLIVFILVELLAAVRAAITEHKLVAEPFLLVGILAAIKELVVLSTFRINSEKTSDAAIKMGVLGAVVIGLAVATLVLRIREREPEESEAAPE